eukprot:5701357-Prymnesium_polylepis.2
MNERLLGVHVCAVCPAAVISDICACTVHGGSVRVLGTYRTPPPPCTRMQRFCLLGLHGSMHESFVFVLSVRDLWTLCPAGGAES